jgi:hypothetical protein
MTARRAALPKRGREFHMRFCVLTEGAVGEKTSPGALLGQAQAD